MDIRGKRMLVIGGMHWMEGKGAYPLLSMDIAEKGRVEFDFDRMYRFIVEEPEFKIVGFGFEILEEAMKIRGVKEIHDRIIAATAKFYRVGILTKDRIINDSGEVEKI